MQCKILLTSLGALDSNNTNLIHFNMENCKYRFPHQLDFYIIKKVVAENIFRTLLSLSCWKSIGSPELMKSSTTLKSFDGRGFQPHGLIPALPVELGGKYVSIHVEVGDAPLDYNILIGRNWFYAMTVATSTMFRTLRFLHLGRIVTIDQLDFCTPDVISPMENNIPMLG